MNINSLRLVRLVLALFVISLAVNVVSAARFKWEVLPLSHNLNYENVSLKGKLASEIVGQPVFVSIATMKERLKSCIVSVATILKGTVVPDHIYIFVSREPFMLDQGVKEEDFPEEMHYLISTGLVSVVFTDNIGPHRKLLPMLDRYWDDDVVIVTFDDDKKLAKTALLRLVTNYLENNRKSIVGLRVRRIGVCEIKPLKFSEYGACKWPRIQNSRAEMLVLPTGNGGVLYRPRFFHEIVFDSTLRKLTLFNDDLTFRLASLVKRVLVVNGCCEILGQCKAPVISENSAIDFSKYSSNSESLELVTANSTKRAELWDSNQILNTKMWQAGLMYLKRLKLLPIDRILAMYLRKDRKECFDALTGVYTGPREHIDTPKFAFLNYGSDNDNTRPKKTLFDQQFHENGMKLDFIKDIKKSVLENISVTIPNVCGFHVCIDDEVIRYSVAKNSATDFIENKLNSLQINSQQNINNNNINDNNNNINMNMNIDNGNTAIELTDKFLSKSNSQENKETIQNVDFSFTN